MSAETLPTDPTPDDDEDKFLKIGDLARLTGKSPRAIHLYEEMGLLSPVSRTKGGFRLFSTSTAARLQWINLLNTMGFSLPQIREFVEELESTGNGPTAMAKLRVIFSEKLKETREHLEQLKSLERELQSGLDYLHECGSCDDPDTLFHVCAGCPYPHDVECAPPLVAGLYAGTEERDE